MRRIRTRSWIAAASGALLFAGGFLTAGLLGASAEGTPKPAAPLPGFSKVVFLSHVNNPRTTPLFPGDPTFWIHTAFTVREDGYYLEVVHEGTHTGTHYSAPCHFHNGAACADDLRPSDLILPAVVIDIRKEVVKDPDHVVGVAELKAWQQQHGQMPQGAAVLLDTGCSKYWADGDVNGEPNYYNCGSGLRGNHQPGFSRNAVKWLIRQGILGKTGATGTDTFGPDPASDASYTETWLTLRRHRLTLENLTNLDAMPPLGAYVVMGSPRNVNGSGAPGSIFGFIP
jgi:kynurenine formamidase